MARWLKQSIAAGEKAAANAAVRATVEALLEDVATRA